MPRFAANLSMLFTEAPFLDRFARAAAAGFDAVEFQFPYAWPATEIRRRLDDLGLVAVMHNLPAGDWERGERGIACRPDRVAEFHDGVARAIDVASTIGVARLNCLAGLGGDVPADAARATLVDNLAFAAAALDRADLGLLVEPLNAFDVPGFFVTGSAEALAILDDVGTPTAALQYDVYHMERTEGDVASTIARLAPRIGHVQIADVPGRGEPGTGTIDFRAVFAALDGCGYAGRVGCEYRPATTTEAGLGWRERFATPRSP